MEASSGQTPTVQLGPFELRRPIGAGGMAEVWQAVHVAQQVQVAVKVLTAERARVARVRAAFRNEVQAVARLNHRGIVMVIDHGLVTADAEAASDGRLVAGSPYLAMELATGGSLKALRKSLEWVELRAVLLELLDALAHAHARGVIHRDLKPANVLISVGEGGPRLELTDFGIAHAIGPGVEALDQTAQVSGTPHYMAPEQIVGDWRDQGPWSDLYALGCMAYELAAGRPPYWGARGHELRRCHMHEPTPPLETGALLPRGFQPWLARLMAKRPSDRYQLAADAAWALLEMSDDELVAEAGLERQGLGRDVPPIATGSGRAAGELDLDGPTLFEGDVLTREAGPFGEAGTGDAGAGDASSAPARTHDMPTRRLDPAATLSTLTELAAFAGGGRSADRRPAEVLLRESRPPRPDLPAIAPPPLPETWRRPDPPRRSMQLVGAGRGLYGLRPVPMVDRDEERDQLWDALARARRASRVRAVIVHGAAGYGKSRLVAWMTQRAHEVGGATTLRATHSPIAGPADGLRRMVASALRCVGLDRDEVSARVSSFVDSHPLGEDGHQVAMALTELIAPALDGRYPPDNGGRDREGTTRMVRVRLGSPEERYAAIRRLLERLCAERPLVIWLEDVQWGSDALGLARSLMEVRPALPVLLLMTVRDDALVERPVEATLLDELTTFEAVEELKINALSEFHQAALVQALLGLESDLARKVLERTAGNPLFAVQLVGDWVQRGVLAVGDRGFVLPEGDEAPLPDDIHQLWTGTLERVVDAVTPDSADAGRRALEIAAALGLDVVDEEWRSACQLGGTSVPPGLVEALITNRLAVAVEGGWSFVHSMVRESIRRTALEAQRWEGHHLTCARMLQRDAPPGHTGMAERLGRHLLAAGELEASLEPLLSGTRERYVESDFRAAHALLSVRFHAMQRMGLPEQDARWGDGWVRRARIQIVEGRLDEALRTAERAEQAATQFRWAGVLARASTVKAHVALARGEIAPSTTEFERAVALFRRVSDPQGLGDALTGLGRALMWQRKLPDALARYEEALGVYEQSGDPFELGHALRGLANVYQCLGDWDHAHEFLERARALFEQLGNRIDVATCLNDLGETERLGGRLQEAERLYRQALDLVAATGVAAASTVRLNLALLLQARGQFVEARGILDAEREALEAGEGSMELLWIYAALLPCAAADADWERFGRLAGRVESLLASSGVVDEDIPGCAELAADLAEEAGQPELARHAYELSRGQWRAAGFDARARAVEEHLTRLSNPAED